MRRPERGAGFPVALVHGIPTGPELFRRVVSLIQGARIPAWEMVGYGASIPTGAGRDISVGRQADDLLSWLESQRIGPSVLAGHDLGGGVVQIASARRPDRCAGLVLFTPEDHPDRIAAAVNGMVREAGRAARAG
jgi:pimeloyl-ACP methyl ester carboxylesterase